MRRLLVSILTYLGLLPIAAGVYYATAKQVAEGWHALLGVLFVDLIICAVVGLVSMTGSYVIHFVGGRHELSVRWMTFGIDLVFWAFVAILVIAAMRT